jgi:multidrug transporter EmrE-like cation transporter
VIVLAVIVALDDTRVSAGDALTSTVGAALVTVFAELYADYLGATIRSGRRPTRAEERKSIRNTALGFLAALLPAVFFVFAVLDTIELHTAFTIATWTGIGVVGTYAFVANRLAGMPILGSAFAGVGFAVLGAILVALKAIVH